MSLFLSNSINHCQAADGDTQLEDASTQLLTRWAADLDPDHVLPEYPRPGLVREDWLNLNGYWEYAIRPTGCLGPAAFDGKILVPFPLE